MVPLVRQRHYEGSRFLLSLQADISTEAWSSGELSKTIRGGYSISSYHVQVGHHPVKTKSIFSCVSTYDILYNGSNLILD